MNYDGAVLCKHSGTEQFLEGGQRPPAWPDALRDDDGYWVVQWRVQAYLRAFDRDTYRAIIREALGMWESVCAIRFIENNRAGYGGIEFGLYPAPQPGGVLADCQLPSLDMPPSTWLDLRMDDSELWSNSKNPASNYVDPVRVICHEAGHGIGISHISDGNLMAPIYSTRIGAPQIGDINQARARYPLPAPKPQQPTSPPRTDRKFREVCKLLAEAHQIVIRNPDGSEVML